MSTAWLAAGQPTRDWSYYDDPAPNRNAAAQQASAVGSTPNLTIGQAQIFGGYIQVFSNLRSAATDMGFKSTVDYNNTNTVGVRQGRDYLGGKSGMGLCGAASDVVFTGRIFDFGSWLWRARR